MLPILLGIFFSTLNFLSPSIIKFPSVFAIYKDFFISLIDTTVISALISTSKYVLISTIISIILGTLLGFILNIDRRIWSLVEPTIDFLRSIPITFFIPAFAVILGVSSSNIIWVLAIIPSTLIILVNIAYGIKEQEKPDKKNRIHQFKLLSGKTNHWAIFKSVTVYEIFPYFITGFKIALSYSIVIVTVLEYMQIGNEYGLGRLVYDEMSQLNYKRVYSIIIIVGLIGYVLNLSVQNIKPILSLIKKVIKKVVIYENR